MSQPNNQPINDKQNREILSSFTEPLSDHEVQWKVQAVFSNNNGLQALVVPYVESRAIMDRLDKAVGLDWYDEFKLVETTDDKGSTKISVECTIYIYDHVKGRYVGRTDVGELSAVADVKGGYSDAFKRAAVKWGIGRLLYSLPFQYVPITPERPRNVNYDDVEFINSRYKVSGQVQYVKGYYVRPKLSEILKKISKVQPLPNQQKIASNNSNSNGPSQEEYMNCITHCEKLISSLGLANDLQRTLNLCGIRAYNNLNELSYEELQKVFNKLNPFRILFDNANGMNAPFEMLMNHCCSYFGVNVQHWTELIGKVSNEEVKQILHRLKESIAVSKSNFA